MRVVYIDVLFALNLGVNYLLLILTAGVGGIFTKRLRLALGALLGAILSVILFFLPISGVMALLSKVMLCFAISAVSFGVKGGKERFLRICLLFCAISCAFAGIIYGASTLLGSGTLSLVNGVPYAPISLRMVLVGSLIAYIVLSIVFGSAKLKPQASFAQLEIERGGRKILLKALLDSGNLLRDPISGKGVIVLSAQTISALFDGAAQSVLQSADNRAVPETFSTLCECGVEGIRLMSCKTAAQNGQMLMIFKCDSIKIDGKYTENHLLGISSVDILTAKGCRAIMGV